MFSSSMKFAPRKDHADESICMQCFRTIRSIPGVLSLAEVEVQHQCQPLDLAPLRDLEGRSASAKK